MSRRSVRLKKKAEHEFVLPKRNLEAFGPTQKSNVIETQITPRKSPNELMRQTNRYNSDKVDIFREYSSEGSFFASDSESSEYEEGYEDETPKSKPKNKRRWKTSKTQSPPAAVTIDVAEQNRYSDDEVRIPVAASAERRRRKLSSSESSSENNDVTVLGSKTKRKTPRKLNISDDEGAPSIECLAMTTPSSTRASSRPRRRVVIDDDVEETIRNDNDTHIAGLSDLESSDSLEEGEDFDVASGPESEQKPDSNLSRKSSERITKLARRKQKMSKFTMDMLKKSRLRKLGKLGEEEYSGSDFNSESEGDSGGGMKPFEPLQDQYSTSSDDSVHCND